MILIRCRRRWEACPFLRVAIKRQPTCTLWTYTSVNLSQFGYHCTESDSFITLVNLIFDVKRLDEVAHCVVDTLAYHRREFEVLCWWVESFRRCGPTLGRAFVIPCNFSFLCFLRYSLCRKYCQEHISKKHMRKLLILSASVPVS